MLEATEQYFAEQDVLKQWLDECTADGGPLAFTRTKELFASWKTWADEERNLEAGSEKSFSEMLANNFAKKRNSAGQWGFVRLILKAAEGCRRVC